MMNYPDEIEDYKLFVSSYYPESLFNDQLPALKSRIILIFKAIDMIDVLSDYTYNEQISNELLNDLKYLLLKLLYVSPINDSYFLALTFRGIAEAELRIFLSVKEGSGYSTEQIKRLSYRDLWSECNQLAKDMNCKIIADKVNNIFKDNSLIIHNKDSSHNTINYLENVMEDQIHSYPLKDYNRNIIDISQFVLDYFTDIFDLNYDLLSMNQKHIFKKIYSK